MLLFAVFCLFLLQRDFLCAIIKVDTNDLLALSKNYVIVLFAAIRKELIWQDFVPTAVLVLKITFCSVLLVEQK